MLNIETKRKIRELGLEGFCEIAEQIEANPAFASTSFNDRISMIIDNVYSEAANKKITSLIKGCKLRLPEADIVNVDYEDRPLNRNQITELETSSFISRTTDVILGGMSGCGRWYERLGGGTHADAIMDRIVHNSCKIKMPT